MSDAITQETTQDTTDPGGIRLALELLEMNRLLEIRVREETEKRMEQERIMLHQSRLAAMGEMIGVIAHQWRQPLSALAITVQSLEFAEDSGSLDPEFVTRIIDNSMKYIMFMSQTIDDFRNFFSSGQAMETFDVRDPIQETVTLLSGQMHNHDIRITIACTGDSTSEIHACRNEFKHVILNLLNNAHDAIADRKETDPGVDGLIAITIIREYGAVLIKIADNGSGVPESLTERIFDPYFTTKEEGKGSGIGLYMSRIMIERNMKGRLRLHNEGDGAVFTVLLPAGRS